MKHFSCVQGGEEWRALRIGLPTASDFDRIITPKKWEPTKSDTRRGYLVHLLTEIILGMPLDGATTPSMIHGTDSEAKARAAYEMMEGVDVELCGLCTTDDGRIGASPDGLLPSLRKSCELKCPSNPEIHCGYMLNPETLVQEYWTQTNGQLFVLGDEYDSTDLVSYFVGMPMVVVNVPKHPTMGQWKGLGFPDGPPKGKDFQSELSEALRLFTADLALYVDLAKRKGWIKPKPETTAKDVSKDWLNPEETEAYIASLGLK